VLQSRFTHVTGFGSRTHTPPWQRSCGVHLLLSASHAVPSALAVGMQPPCPSQLLAVVHAPTSQVYAVPTGFTGLLHWPVLSLQAPGSWH